MFNGLVANTLIVTFQQDQFFVSINDKRFLITCSYVPGQITTQAAIETQIVNPGL